jgi:hypothetical protein
MRSGVRMGSIHLQRSTGSVARCPGIDVLPFTRPASGSRSWAVDRIVRDSGAPRSVMATPWLGSIDLYGAPSRRAGWQRPGLSPRAPARCAESGHPIGRGRRDSQASNLGSVGPRLCRHVSPHGITPLHDSSPSTSATPHSLSVALHEPSATFRSAIAPATLLGSECGVVRSTRES